MFSTRSQTKRGQSLVEVMTAMMVAIPVILILIDCLFVFLGASMNDNVCRDAARAAAAGPPSQFVVGSRAVDQGGQPNRRAVTVIKRVYYSGLPMKVRETAQVIENVRDVPPKSQGGAIDGKVSVTTTIDVYPPFQVSWIHSGSFVLKSQHEVPITYVRPAL